MRTFWYVRCIVLISRFIRGIGIQQVMRLCERLLKRLSHQFSVSFVLCALYVISSFYAMQGCLNEQ